MMWSVKKRASGSRGDTSLGTLEAPTPIAALQLALDRFRAVGLTIANAVIEEKAPEY